MRDEELKALRKAWSAVRAPEPFRPLSEEDTATQRAVAWLQDALQAQIPTALPAPARRTRMLHPILTLLTLAAAAVVALLLLQPFRAESAAILLPMQAASQPAVEVLVSRPGRLELRSGPVRLTLLHPPPTSHRSQPTSTP